MIQEIVFYGIGIFFIFLFYRIIKSQMKLKSGCLSCSGSCVSCEDKK
jgi:hypothetical protein